MIRVEKIVVNLQHKMILKDLSVAFPSARISLLIGPSGAGKTTLLKLLAGLVPTQAGSVLIDDCMLSRLTPKKSAELIGYVFQNFNLFPHLTVLENCIDPLIVHGLEHQQALALALNMLSKLQMQDFANQYPQQLSGGQQQRVAIARALCLKPRVLLLDEPTASLDPHNTLLLVDILKQLVTENMTVIVCTQDLHFAKQLFDNVYYLANGQIKEHCDGLKNLVNCPLIGQFI